MVFLEAFPGMPGLSVRHKSDLGRSLQSRSVECLNLRRTTLSRDDAPTEGYETLEVLAEIDPIFVVDWHIHPGTEAGYALECGGELRVKGEAT
jgi:hypothetical protein